MDATIKPKPLNDSAAETDSFGVFSRHTRSLAEMLMSEFLKAPFTLGIFGSWGTGKSSFMNFLLKDLRAIDPDKVVSIHFYPWQFENKDDLFNALMLSVITCLEDLQKSLNLEAQEMTKSALSTLKNMTKRLAFMAIDAKLKQWSGGHIEFDNFVENYQKQTIERTRFINQFQKQFQEVVETIFDARGSSNARLFIFIDDLDRCTPENSITVLETMKLFFDADRCFFIVGIDKQVVQRGIEVKYNRHEMIRGQDYLDKLIQLPFNLPTIPQASLEAYAKEFLQGHEFAEAAPKIISIVADKNPRRLKRLLNCIVLISQVVQSSNQNETKSLDPQRLVLLLALQVRYPTIHGLITAAPEVSNGLLTRNTEDNSWSKLTSKGHKKSADALPDLSEDWFRYIDDYRSHGVSANLPMPMKHLLLSGESILGKGAAIDNLYGYLRILQAVRDEIGELWFEDVNDLDAYASAAGILQTEQHDFSSSLNRANQITQDQASLNLSEAVIRGGSEQTSISEEQEPINSELPSPTLPSKAETTEMVQLTAIEEQIEHVAKISQRWRDLISKARNTLRATKGSLKREFKLLQEESIEFKKTLKAWQGKLDASGKSRLNESLYSLVSSDEFFAEIRFPGWRLIFTVFLTIIPGAIYWILVNQALQLMTGPDESTNIYLASYLLPAKEYAQLLPITLTAAPFITFLIIFSVRNIVIGLWKEKVHEIETDANHNQTEIDHDST